MFQRDAISNSNVADVLQMPDETFILVKDAHNIGSLDGMGVHPACGMCYFGDVLECTVPCIPEERRDNKSVYFVSLASEIEKAVQRNNPEVAEFFRLYEKYKDLVMQHSSSG